MAKHCAPLVLFAVCIGCGDGNPFKTTQGTWNMKYILRSPINGKVNDGSLVKNPTQWVITKDKQVTVLERGKEVDSFRIEFTPLASFYDWGKGMSDGDDGRVLSANVILSSGTMRLQVKTETGYEAFFFERPGKTESADLSKIQGKWQTLGGLETPETLFTIQGDRITHGSQIPMRFELNATVYPKTIDLYIDLDGEGNEELYKGIYILYPANVHSKSPAPRLAIRVAWDGERPTNFRHTSSRGWTGSDEWYLTRTY